MRQQVVGVLFLQLDDAFVVERNALRPLQAVGVRHTVAFLEDTPHVEVQVHVDAVLLELGDQEVQPVELLSIEGTGIVLAAVGNAGGSPLVQEMQADDVDAIAGQGGGPHGSIFFRRQFDRAGTPVGEMDAPKADAPAVGLDQVSALNADVAVLSRRSVVQERNIRRRARRRAVVHHIRLEQAVVPLGLGEAGQGKRDQSSDYLDRQPN